MAWRISANAARHAGRRLVVDGHHRLERVRAILGELGLDERRVHAAAPVAGHELDHEPELLGHRPPERGEVAGLEHQHAVARRQRVDEGGFPRAGARSGVDHDRALGLENVLQALEDLEGELRELGARGGRSSGGPSPAGRGPGRSSARGSAGNAGRTDASRAGTCEPPRVNACGGFRSWYTKRSVTTRRTFGVDAPQRVNLA